MKTSGKQKQQDGGKNKNTIYCIIPRITPQYNTFTDYVVSFLFLNYEYSSSLFVEHPPRPRIGISNVSLWWQTLLQLYCSPCNSYSTLSCVSLFNVVNSLVTPLFLFLLLLLFGSEYIFIHILLVVVVVVRIPGPGC